MRTPCARLHTVKARKQIAVWVAPGTHTRFQALAEQQGMTMSGLLADLVDDFLDREPRRLQTADAYRSVRSERVCIRLRPGDAKSLSRRAMSRRTKPSTYIAALVRAHLVADPPLPAAELAALERATAELSAIGRNLNQVARSLNAGAAAPAGTAEAVAQSAQVAEEVRAAAKLYVRKAVAAWEAPLG